ncbi:hypothetical protein TRM7557_03057 [Tritonibacter multivorans]|uniref:Nudix hydrolase domain-containing protein n=1 Tax=Tritonibacter multivorans TaxID=928856 RepID=A0A0P1GFV1_9RHOB|nr:hypothetical protein TRM7557_03057 [Tritonibacter multivorans]SFC85977.1 ADP-ribose pyrophosphatase YjhB, NUDIX family [Tritonibacter multivorans]
MTVWRPSQSIKVKALGLHWRAGRLLAAEVEDDKGRIKGVRPLGGTVEFGETWQQTLIREFREELDVDVKIDGVPLVLENIFRHEGMVGHEILFVAPVLFPEGAFAEATMIQFREDNGVLCTARWFSLKSLRLHGIPLFPEGLAEALSSGVRGDKGGKSETASSRPFNMN